MFQCQKKLNLKCLIIEKRNHIAGNCFDKKNNIKEKEATPTTASKPDKPAKKNFIDTVEISGDVTKWLDVPPKHGTIPAHLSRRTKNDPDGVPHPQYKGAHP